MALAPTGDQEMIVEFLGPPSVGKTTLANALVVRLRDAGCPVELVSSYRPTEIAGSRSARPVGRCNRPSTAALRRLTRPAFELLAALRKLSDGSVEADLSKVLIGMLPPRSFLWSLRLRQYVLRLSRAWRHSANQNRGIALFDQAYAQAVCSLAFLSGMTDPEHIGHALDCVPHSDLIIQLCAPREVLVQRLLERKRGQSGFERLFELDLDANLELAPIAERVHEVLRGRGWRTISIASDGREPLSQAVDRIASELTAMLKGDGELHQSRRDGDQPAPCAHVSP